MDEPKKSEPVLAGTGFDRMIDGSQLQNETQPKIVSEIRDGDQKQVQ